MDAPKQPAIKLLIVEDEAALRETLASYFKRYFTVYTAAGGTEAFEMIKSMPIDIVLSDVTMPNGTGSELTESIRTMTSPRPVVILLTGYSDLSEKKAISTGAYRLITKPCSRKILMNCVEEIIARRLIAPVA